MSSVFYLWLLFPVLLFFFCLFRNKIIIIICYSRPIKLYFTLLIFLFFYFIYALAFYLVSYLSILFVFLLFIYFLLWSQLIISGWSTTSGNKKEFPVWNLRLRLHQENGINFTFSFSDFWFLFSVNVQICMRTYIALNSYF